MLSVYSAYLWVSGACFRGRAESHLCIEAGVKGWESIEFKELYQSACEYLPPENVHRLIVQKDKNYLKQIAGILQSKPITHYLYDPRTDNSDVLLWRPLWQSFLVSLLFLKKGVVPIILLTDLSVRRWRSQSAIVSAKRGVVVTFMSPRRVAPIFPHRRLVGPSLMPFSVKTKQMLDALIVHRQIQNPSTAIFTGSLYEPRTTVLQKVKTGLSAKGFELVIKSRGNGGPRCSDKEYWERLCYSDIVFTTSDQAIQKGADWTDIPHLIYRYIEVLASGSLLVAQDVPSVHRYFIPSEHFVSYSTPEEAINVIAYYLTNNNERFEIARRGKDKADALILSRSFWLQVDSALGGSAML